LHHVKNEAGDTIAYDFHPEIGADDAGRSTMLSARRVDGSRGAVWNSTDGIHKDWLGKNSVMADFAAEHGVHIEKTGGIDGVRNALNKEGVLRIPLKNPILGQKAPIATPSIPGAPASTTPSTVIPDNKVPLSGSKAPNSTAPASPKLSPIQDNPNTFQQRSSRASAMERPIGVAPESGVDPFEAKLAKARASAAGAMERQGISPAKGNTPSSIPEPTMNSRVGTPPPLPESVPGAGASPLSGSGVGDKLKNLGMGAVKGLAKGIAGVGVGALVGGAADEGTQQLLGALGVENQNIKSNVGGGVGAVVGGAAGEVATLGAGALMGGQALTAAAAGTALASGAAVGAAGYAGYKLGEFIGDKTGLHDALGNALGGASELNTKATGTVGGNADINAKNAREDAEEEAKLAANKGSQPSSSPSKAEDEAGWAKADAEYKAKHGTPTPTTNPTSTVAINPQQKGPTVASDKPYVRTYTSSEPTNPASYAKDSTSDNTYLPNRNENGARVANPRATQDKASDHPEDYEGMDDRVTMNNVPKASNPITMPKFSSSNTSMGNRTSGGPSAGQYRGNSNMGMAPGPQRQEKQTLQSTMAQQNQKATSDSLGQMGSVQSTSSASSGGFQGSVLPSMNALSSPRTSKTNEFKYSSGSRLA